MLGIYLFLGKQVFVLVEEHRVSLKYGMRPHT